MPLLQDPIRLHTRELSNRLVMAPMVTAMAKQHEVSEAHLTWYRERAQGLGLVIVECAAIAPEGLLVPRQLGLWEDRFVAGLAKLAHAIHDVGVPAVLQIVHGGARACIAQAGMTRLGATTSRMAPGPAPRAMTHDDLQTMVQAFADAARRAVAAGFDGVELHGAHGYLLNQFLSPAFNTRTDNHGGDLQGRSRLLMEVVEAVKEVLDPHHLLLVRMHGTEAVEGGWTAQDAVTLGGMLEAAGVHGLDISGIAQASRPSDELGAYLATGSVKGRGWEPAAFAASAGLVKRTVSIPVITVGRMAENDTAAQVLARGDADMVALARQLITDPAAGRKLLAGHPEQIHPCRECLACFPSIRTGPIRCSEW